MYSEIVSTVYFFAALQVALAIALIVVNRKNVAWKFYLAIPVVILTIAQLASFYAMESQLYLLFSYRTGFTLSNVSVSLTEAPQYKPNGCFCFADVAMPEWDCQDVWQHSQTEEYQICKFATGKCDNGFGFHQTLICQVRKTTLMVFNATAHWQGINSSVSYTCTMPAFLCQARFDFLMVHGAIHNEDLIFPPTVSPWLSATYITAVLMSAACIAAGFSRKKNREKPAEVDYV